MQERNVPKENKIKTEVRNKKEDVHEKERMVKGLWQISKKYLGRKCACLDKISNISVVNSCATEGKLQRIEMD